MKDADWPIRRKADYYLLFSLRYDTKIDKHVSEKFIINSVPAKKFQKNSRIMEHPSYGTFIARIFYDSRFFLEFFSREPYL